ncbi:MAG: OmpH/Skp family outer membrane protein [Planctomycetota bacterium]|jgi:Skp family chaperone for outer membrane proteins
MKTKIVVLGCLMGVVVLFFVHEFSLAQPNAGNPTSKIGLVSVSSAMSDCKATATFSTKMAAENNQMKADEEDIATDIKTLTGALGALVPGSSDYMTQYKQLLQKQGELKGLQEFNNSQRGLRPRAWAEKVYKEVLRITKEVAAKKGLDLVLERSEPTFPIQGADQLMMTLSTHKVLYGGGCTDITDDVIAELDKIESELIK